MSTVLLVEDHSGYAGLVCRELGTAHGHETVLVSDPAAALRELATRAYDVAVVDVLYEPLVRDFAARRTRGGLAGPLLASGLSVIRAAGAAPGRPRPVIWSSGEANRHLHLLFAFQEFGVRAYCSKGTGSVEPLHRAIVAAAAGGRYVDRLLDPYLPAAGAVPLRRTILRDQSRRAIWRAIALGYHSRRELATITGYSDRHIGNLVPTMVAEDLQLLDPGLRPGRSPLSELVRFAAHHWEFLLDEAVRELYP